MIISNALNKKFFVLMSMPLVFFGISAKIISYSIYLEKPKEFEAKSSMTEKLEKKDNALSLSLNQNRNLPLVKVLVPARKRGRENIIINAKSVLAIDNYSGKVLYEKNADQKVKIASLTKLATAGTLLDFIKNESLDAFNNEEKYSLSRVVAVSKAAVEAEGDSGYLIVGEKIKAGDLLKIMLIASSNDASYALAEDISRFKDKEGQGIDYFIGLMNDFAKKEGLENTRFTNPAGIDEQDNFSSSANILKLSASLLRNYPEIFAITRIDKANIKSADGKNDHNIKNTNKLLGSLPGIIGGKTGYTDEAGESLLLVVKDSTAQHEISAVVIGAEGRFNEMEKLVSWIWNTYEWK